MHNRLQFLYLSNVLSIAVLFSLKKISFIDQIRFEGHYTNFLSIPTQKFLPNSNYEKYDIFLLRLGSYGCMEKAFSWRYNHILIHGQKLFVAQSCAKQGGGWQLLQTHQHSKKKKGRRLEIGMHKAWISKLLSLLLGCWKITEGHTHSRLVICWFLTSFAQGLEITFTAQEWEKQFAQSIMLAVSSGGHFPETTDFLSFSVVKQLSVTNQLIH